MTNLLFRDNMPIIFFIVFCGFFSVVSLLRINKLEGDIENLHTQVITISQYLERSLNQIKYLREDYSDQHHDLKHEVFNKIETLEECLIESFQKERIQLEETKANKTKDTFKNLKAAFSPVDVKIEKDGN
jgi:hypothetical protein